MQDIRSRIPVTVSMYQILHTIIYVLTGGGPGYATDVVFIAVFDEFSKGRYGLGTALSSVLFIGMTTAGFFIVRQLTRNPVEA